MDFKKILNIIAKAGQNGETVKIYYPKTENTPAGWREVEPYSLATDTGEEGEHLVFGKETITPGHIFNAYTIGSEDSHCDSFILGKIKLAKRTNKRFKPRWKIEF